MTLPDPYREDPYREWDGAYVMGSLSPSERREYEQHLSSCADCAGEVASLAGISGILSGVPPEQALALLPDGSAAASVSRPAVVGGPSGGGSLGACDGAFDGGVVRRLGDDVPPPSLLPKLLAASRAARRRTRLRVTALVAAAAAVAAAVALAVPLLLTGPSETVASGQLVSLSQAVPSPITAEATLFAEPWGTRIQVVCWYARDTTSAGAAPVRAFRYALHVTDRSGADTQVASWNASAGSRSTPVATTNLPRDQIGTIDIRLADTGLVLLEAHP